MNVLVKALGFHRNEIYCACLDFQAAKEAETIFGYQWHFANAEIYLDLAMDTLDLIISRVNSGLVLKRVYAIIDARLLRLQFAAAGRCLP